MVSNLLNCLKVILILLIMELFLTLKIVGKYSLIFNDLLKGNIFAEMKIKRFFL